LRVLSPQRRIGHKPLLMLSLLNRSIGIERAGDRLPQCTLDTPPAVELQQRPQDRALITYLLSAGCGQDARTLSALWFKVEVNSGFFISSAYPDQLGTNRGQTLQKLSDGS
jgi:hypothetical protein